MPNIVVIFADDLGYGDLGCFGSTKHRTPNIDRMAAQGMRLTDFYSTCGVCTPSRASLMTGCYPRRINMHQSERRQSVLFPGGARGISAAELTVAELLKQRGYATAIVGKWHLGDQPPFLPTRHGFDSYFGIPYSNDMGLWNQRGHYPPLPVLRDEKVIETEPDQAQLTRRYTEEAVRFITANKDRPFFLYLPHTMPHNPVAASERFAGKSANGRYGDSVEEIDWSTGEILATIARLGLDGRTLVLFTSDNGAASRWGGSNRPLSGFKGSTMEGGMRVPCVARWPGKIPAGSTCAEITSTIDVLPTLARLAGTEPPTDRIIDGRDVGALLFGVDGAKSPHEAFYYYQMAQLQCVRSGPWKLHLPRGGNPNARRAAARPKPPRLYDLSTDVAERQDIASDHPDIVARLTALADKARQDLGDGPKPGKNQRPAGHVANPQTLTTRKQP